MSHSVDLGELGNWLANETRGGSEVAVLAGHFAIFTAGSTAVDLLDDLTAVPAGAQEMIDFTRTTWRVACDVAAQRRDRQFRFVPLVDDIQFVRPQAGDRAAAERLGAALSAGYLESTPRLPSYHVRELASRGIAADRIVPSDASQWLFSERQLRLAAVHRIRDRLRRPDGAGSGLAATDNGNSMTVTLPDHGDYCLIQSGHTSCAGGYVELLLRLWERGVRKLVALVPERCLTQVTVGTRVARQVFGLQDLAVTNAGIPGRNTTARAVIASP